MEIHGPHRAIIAEAVVPASRPEVWQAWTTESGLRSFFSPHVEMELRIGGPFHILFDMDQLPGLRGADDMRVMAFDLESMLAFDWNAPPELPEIRPQRTHVTVYFEGASGGGTRITLIHDGWGTSPAWDAAFAYFDTAWKDVVLPRLRWRFENGPVDWAHRPDLQALAQKGRLLQVFDQEQRQTQAFTQSRRFVSNGVIRNLDNHEKRGYIAFSHLPERGVDQIISEQISFYTAHDCRFEWPVYDHDTPAGLKERLSAAGFTPEKPEALVVLDLDTAPESFFQPADLDIRRVSNPDELLDLLIVEQAVWNDDWTWLIKNLRTDLVENPDIVSIYIGYVENQPAACAWAYFHPGTSFASFWGGSTREEFRGIGFYTSLLAVRAAEVRQRGFRYIRVDASPMSRPILEKHGFIFLTMTTPYNWSPPSAQQEE
jgi:uncharacterized protein YndB with AHSA1/START domain